MQYEAHVVARAGDGSYVADNLDALASTGQVIQGLRPPVSAGPFRVGAPEIATFPFALWDRLARQAFKEQRISQAQYLDPASSPALTDRNAPGDTQDVLARFITEGHLLRHLRRMRELYPQRQQVLINALATQSKGRLVLQPSEQGMHLLHELGKLLRNL